ncbi:MAG: sigma-54 dependent transcriptional regulator, partial [SAR324 cluster bacterium]|nr:sigma-54 dependent transcriptional regulator [SAR324 cluster bacterium]
MRILIIDDEPYVEALIKGWFRSSEHELNFLQSGATLMREGATFVKKYDVVIIDKQLPEVDGLQIGKHLKENYPGLVTIMVTGFESTETLVSAFRDSHFDDYISKPFDSRKLQDSLLRAQRLVEERHALTSEYKLNESLRLRTIETPKQLVGQSPRFLEMMALIEKFAPLEGPILIRGETGTGKELVAREIYKRSRRQHGSFVPVNCGAIPAELFESELFGHEKGAFTGAIGKKEGLVKLADGGTLFLDEIGDTPLALQVKLLRMLQEGEILSVGSNRQQKVNVRVISATNQKLEDQIKVKDFREDLLYRLNVFTIYLPPLRERQEDLPMLIQHFIQKNSTLNPRVVGVDPNALEMLSHWPWEGNIRELENVIQRTCALAESEYLRPEDFKEIYHELVKGQPKFVVPKD